MHVEHLQENDLHKYDSFLKSHTLGSVFQSRDWLKYQEVAFKLKGTIFVGLEKDEIVNSVLFFEYPLPFRKCYLYAPRGPLFSKHKEQNDKLLDEVKKHAQKDQAIFFRIDPLMTKEVNLNDLVSTPTKNSFSHQPQTSLLLDLTKGEELLLKEMKEKGRYNIRLAEKKGVVVEPGKVEELYPLLEATGERDGFHIHGLEKYEAMVKSLDEHILVLVAKVEGKVIAGGIFLFYNKTAIYYYGASGNEHRNLMAPYLVQWKAIQEGIKRGCTTYDFLGISNGDDPNHPWKGVTEFKLKFGGTMLEYIQPQEMVYQPFWHFLYHLRKKV